MSNRAEELSDGTEQQPDKPRGDCTGCKFNYQLGTARSGEFKGQLVIRRHNSRTGPGLCEGSQRPPKGAETDEPACCEPCEGAETDGHTKGCTEEARFGPSVCAGCPGPEEPVTYVEAAPAQVHEFMTPAVPLVEIRIPAAPGPMPVPPQPDPFTAPAPMPAELPQVSGQPDPDRDRWQRYLIHGQAHTRATTFTKAGSSTFSLNEWQQRMVVLGLTQRRDLLAMAHGLDVKRDRKQLNQIAEDAKNAAGSKVAANLGTALHAFSERLDAGLMNVADVPPEYQQRMMEYLRTIENAGLTTRPEWIERTTAVRADQVSALLPVAGTLDRIFQLPNGELVIGDLKGLALTERLPTPGGWTTMGAVSVGDTVFDAYGSPCTVTAKSEVKRIGTYTVRFDDGSSVVCDTEHIWWTASGHRPGEPTAVPIGTVIDTLRSPQGQAWHRVPVAGSLQLPDADLPVDPYLLGCWLGDGAARGDTITKGRDLFEILESDGHVLGVEQKCHSDKCFTRSVSGLTTGLRGLGLLHNKNIPGVYLRASVAQRQQLLRGLLDTDGCWNTARKTAVFTSTEKQLALQVEELLLSLGQRPYLADTLANGFGKDVVCYSVSFTPVDLQPFRLPRKADQAAVSTKPNTRSRRRVIVAIDQGPDVDTACIAVDSPTRTYLCGDRMIPTHNTGSDLSYGWGEIATQLAVYAHGVNAHGLFDWRRKEWELPTYNRKVRTDYGIVIHLPAGGDGCTLYRVDLVKGWERAQVCGRVMQIQKDGFAIPLTVDALPQPLDTPPGPTDEVSQGRSDWDHAVRVFSEADSKDRIRKLYQYAMDSGKFTEAELNALVTIGFERLSQLTPA